MKVSFLDKIKTQARIIKQSVMLRTVIVDFRKVS